MRLFSRARALTLLVVSSVAGACHAQASSPAVGSFGFDWLRPGAAKCVALTAKDLKALRSCEYSAEGSFGLTDPVFKCRRSERSEYVIYGSKAACLRNLETMKANAP